MGIRTKLIQLWTSLRSSFWFIPALMILAAAVLAGVMVEVDSRAGNRLTESFPRVFGTNPEGARVILSSIASSMVGIAGVTFSITIVVLSLASAQYTSRVLLNFMRDRANQFVLGVFVSIFVYCLIVLRAIRDGNEPFIPVLAVATGILFSIVSIGFLIFFIHHVASSIQASTILSRIGRETVAVISALYPEEHRGEEDDSEEAETHIRDHSWCEVPSKGTGYVQSVDVERLMDWAEKNQTIVRMMHGTGEFAIAGRPVLMVAREELPGDKSVAELNSLIGVASFRTIEQDVGFGIRQLVDISLRALSPGLNDTTTAVNCLHYLGVILERVGGRKIPGEVIRREGKLRLIARTQTFRYLVDEALTQIRQEARGNVAVHLAMLGTIEAALRPGLSQCRRKVFQNHLIRIKRVVDNNVQDPDDQEVVRQRFEEVEGLLQPSE